MANKKFSQLTSAVSLTDTDIIPIVDGTGTKKIAASAVKTYATSGLATVATTGSYDSLFDKPNTILEFNITDGTSGQVLTTDGAGNLSFTTVSGGAANTGDVTFDGVKIIGSGTASGDGLGFSTLELVPDNNLYGNHQYLVVDPTAPGHIHIRAGGPQDNSNAQLFLGGENTHVRIVDGDNAIRMAYQQSSTLSSVTLTAGVDYSTAEWVDNSGNYSIVFNNVQQSTLDAIWGLSGSTNTFEVYDGVSYTTITGYYGSSTPGLGQVASLSVGQAPATSPTTVVSVTLNSIGITASYVEVSGSDVRIDAQDDVRIFSRDTFLLANYSTSDPVVIRTDYNGNDYGWEFRTDGVLELPSGGDIIRNGNSIIPLDITDLTDNSGLLTTTAEPKFDIKSTAFIASSNTRYGVDTTSGAITAVLPVSPNLGDAVFFADAGGAFATNNLTIDRNSNTINGDTADIIINVNGDSIGLFWNGTTWRLYE